MTSIIERFEGGETITTGTSLPYGYNSYASDVIYWSAAADALGCSVDYLMGRTDDPLPTAQPVARAADAPRRMDAGRHQSRTPLRLPCDRRSELR